MLRSAGNNSLSKTVEAPVATVAARRAAKSAFRGLLWAEWFAHSKLLLLSLCLWLSGVWALPVLAHPGWILLLGGIYALLAGPAYGGTDILEGCEEFSFSLPATRGQRYVARMALGGGTLLVLSLMNVLALGLDLPQVLARLYVETGLIKPLPVLKPGLLYGLILALPVTIFAFSFALSSATHSRMFLLTTWFWGGLGGLGLLQIGFWFEELIWKSLNGYFSCPLLLVGGAAVLGIGYRVYRGKEIGQRSAPITLPGKWWLWIILFLAGAATALALVSSIAKSYPKFLVPSEQH
ncbi:MAG: hypothetical protein FJ403_15060 [Verrucomicrobia bacterium]|nr:hypothetical protein [Verrucomicrobiota bacterium]